MFDRTSRYADLEIAVLIAPGAEPGDPPREIAYVTRRFVPRPEGLAVFAEHIVFRNDRLDNIAARYLNDPTLFWQITDANLAMHPDELTEFVGSVIRLGLRTP